MTFQSVGPTTGACVRAFSQISSSPKTTRVGACVTGSLVVGSTAIQLLYQDWTPGPYPRTAPPASALPLPGASSCSQVMIFFQVLPKSAETYAPSRKVASAATSLPVPEQIGMSMAAS